jgi:hypothetical protein
MWEEQKGYGSVERGLSFMELFSDPEYVLASLSVCGVCFTQPGM